jgi:hypothetical protein
MAVEPMLDTGLTPTTLENHETMAARPATRATRSARDRSGEAPARTPVRDLTRGAASFRIDWDVRPAYDFVFSLSGEAGETDDLPAEDRAWLKTAKTALPASVRDGDKQIFDAEFCVSAAALLVDRPEVRTARAFVDALAEATPGEVIRGVFEYSNREPDVADLIDRAIAGDEGALTALDETLPDQHREGRLEMIRRPERTVSAMVNVLAAWSDLFTPIEPRIAEILERDYESRTADRATLAPAELIERTTGGIRWLPEAGVRRLILAPKHHLALLRAAGLVTITESGSVVYYTLRRNRLDDASTDIKRFLLS